MADDSIAVEWREVKGFPAYEVSNTGLVRRVLPRANGRVSDLPYVLKPRIEGAGYEFVSLCRDGRTYQRKVHRLVALHFHGEPPSPRHCVAHNDGDKRNNYASNLRWATYSENYRDSVQHGTCLTGLTHPHAKLTPDAVADIRQNGNAYRGAQRAMARKYGVTPSVVCEILAGRTWVNV